MAEELKVDVRQERGKRRVRRLRRAGMTPGVLYGHGQQNICLSVPADQLDALVHHGSRMVTLTGAVNESALIREVQWDTWGSRVLHVDLARVSADERVEVEVPIELRGEAPGVKEGGLIKQLIHEVEIQCPAAATPEKIEVSINELKLHDSITLADLQLPEKAVVKGDSAAVVVQCVEPVEVPEVAEVAEEVTGEPELIGAKEEDEQKGKKES